MTTDERLRLEIVSVLENGSGFIDLEHAEDVYNFVVGDDLQMAAAVAEPPCACDPPAADPALKRDVELTMSWAEYCAMLAPGSERDTPPVRYSNAAQQMAADAERHWSHPPVPHDKDCLCQPCLAEMKQREIENPSPTRNYKEYWAKLGWEQTTMGTWFNADHGVRATHPHTIP